MRCIARGFTLIELMVVITIIAILASILVPSFERSRSSAQLRSCMENLHSMGTAYESYIADHGADPASDKNMWTLLVPQYLPVIPTCPSSGMAKLTNGAGYAWEYAWSSTPGFWTVFCVGAHNDMLPPGHGPIGPYYSPREGVMDGTAGYNP